MISSPKKVTAELEAADVGSQGYIATCAVCVMGAFAFDNDIWTVPSSEPSSKSAMEASSYTAIFRIQAFLLSIRGSHPVGPILSEAVSCSLLLLSTGTSGCPSGAGGDHRVSINWGKLLPF